MKTGETIELLKQLISIPSPSREEDKTADAIQSFLNRKGIAAERHLNNVWARNKYFDPHKHTMLLNSHHDTVKPNENYTRNPYNPVIENGKLFGLGSNDAGGCLTSLLAVFVYYYKKDNLPYNLIYAATAEEEISGRNGIESILDKIGIIEFAIVGEPTLMQMAIAEMGLMVLDCKTKGKAAHAARYEGINAIYLALKDIDWFRTHKFPKISELLGPVKMTVTSIYGGVQHNVIPEKCDFIVDIRINELYTHEEILNTIKENVKSEITPRSNRLRSTLIPESHPIVQAGLKSGLLITGSATSSDKGLMPFPALKVGPGDSNRSHIADEYIFLSEINKGVELYINMLNVLFQNYDEYE